MNAEPPSDTIRAQLRKIQALVESGIGGEAENAKRMLETLCKRYGISVEQILSPEVRRFRFTKPPAHHWDLFVHCFCFVTRKNKITYHKAGRSVLIELTLADFIDLRACFAHYQPIFEQEIEDLFLAFAGKHHIWGAHDPDAPEGEPMDPERMARLFAKMKGIGGESWKKPLAALTK